MPDESLETRLDRHPARPVITRLDRPLPAWQRRLYRTLTLRMPWLVGVLARVVVRRPPHSRLRRFAYSGGTLIAFEGFSRNEFRVPSPFYEPNAALHVDRKQVGLGFETVYRGPEAIRRFSSDWADAWSEHSLVPHELLDGGDVFAVRATISGRGARSGVETRASMTHVYRVDPRSGLVVEHRTFFDDADAMREAGFGQLP